MNPTALPPDASRAPSGGPGFIAGLGSSVAIGVGYVPMGFSFGVAAVQAGLSAELALLVSLTVYAGASQFLLISLLLSGAALWTTLPAVLMMNARHALYGPSLAPLMPVHSGSVASPWLAFGLTDEVFATALNRLPSVEGLHRERWIVGLQVGAYAAWAGGTALGVMLAGHVGAWPAAVQDGIAFVLPALIFALLLDAGVCRWWVPVAAAVAATLVAGWYLPAHHALVLGILAGALAHVGYSRVRG
jgi:4-azaleucine resistance transporter AzlC